MGIYRAKCHIQALNIIQGVSEIILGPKHSGPKIGDLDFPNDRDRWKHLIVREMYMFWPNLFHNIEWDVQEHPV